MLLSYGLEGAGTMWLDLVQLAPSTRGGGQPPPIKSDDQLADDDAADHTGLREHGWRAALGTRASRHCFWVPRNMLYTKLLYIILLGLQNDNMPGRPNRAHRWGGGWHEGDGDHYDRAGRLRAMGTSATK